MWHTRERTEKYIRFGWESPKARDHSGDQGVDERMRSKWIIGRLAGCVCVCVRAEWIHLAQDRDQWQAFVNIMMNL
jgi:hypothetical protein